MMLLTPDIRARLVANALEGDADHVPVAKFFNPMGAGVWLPAYLSGDGDTLFGIADLEMGCPEYGSFSLAELQGLDTGLGLGIERDILFETRTRMSIWLDIAKTAGSVRKAECIIDRLEREC